MDLPRNVAGKILERELLVGVLFSAYLSYLELFVLRAICQWCVASAVLVVACLVLGALRLRNTGSDVPGTADGR